MLSLKDSKSLSMTEILVGSRGQENPAPLLFPWTGYGKSQA